MARHDQSLEELGIEPRATGADDWAPTPHGRVFASVLAEHPELYEGADALELGAGTGIHTILLERGGAARITATEITAELLETTRRNVQAHGCGARTDYVVADWLDVAGEYDVIVTNPPFCKSGKANRRYFIDDLILNGHKRLRPEGRIVFIQSSMAGLDKTRRRLDENGFDHEVIDSATGPFRDYYYDEPGFIDEARRVPNGFSVVDGKEHETLFVLHASLRH